ncbi:polymorphic toxin-type HINT domain-containing protein [Deinococcus roseus]|uniref:polymorphic toxin-type HINT domain-containing protein n=1 Tax=Deinococcus roseus TaxID=392414 RepID=UPI0016667A03|nr:polymorphic toxin-type HINT domain-containing protein [Deinococcus roseus]
MLQQLVPLALASPSLYARPGAGVSDLPIEVLAFNTPGFGDVSDAINLATGNVYVDTGSLARNNVLDASKEKDEKADKTIAGSNWNLQSRKRLAGYTQLPSGAQLAAGWTLYSGDGSGTRYNPKTISTFNDPKLPYWIQRYSTGSPVLFKTNSDGSNNYANATLAIYASESTPGTQVTEQYLVLVKILENGTPMWVAHHYDHSGNRSTFYRDDEFVDYQQNLSQQYRAELSNDKDGTGASPKTEITYHTNASWKKLGLITEVKDEWGRKTTFSWDAFNRTTTTSSSEPPVLLAINELVQNTQSSWIRQTRFSYAYQYGQLLVKQVMYIAQTGRIAPSPSAVNTACGDPTLEGSQDNYSGTEVCSDTAFKQGNSTAGGYMARTFTFTYSKTTSGHVVLGTLEKPLLRADGGSNTAVDTYRYTYDDNNPPRIKTFNSDSGENLSYTYTPLNGSTPTDLSKGFQVTVQDGTDKVERFEIDKSGQITQHEVDVKDPVNGNSSTPLRWTYQYYPNGFTAAVIEPGGKSTHYGYDSRGNVISQTVYKAPKINVTATSPLPIDVDLNLTAGQTVNGLDQLTFNATLTGDDYNNGASWGVKGATVVTADRSKVVVKNFSDQVLLEVTGTSRTDNGTYDKLIIKFTRTGNGYAGEGAYTWAIQSETPVVSGEKLSSSMNPPVLGDWETHTKSTYTPDNLPATTATWGATDSSYGYSGQLTTYDYGYASTSTSRFHVNSQLVKQCVTASPYTTTVPACDGTEATVVTQYNRTLLDDQGRTTSLESGAVVGGTETPKTSTELSYPNNTVQPVRFNQWVVTDTGSASQAGTDPAKIIQYADQPATSKLYGYETGKTPLSTTEIYYDALGVPQQTTHYGPGGTGDQNVLVANVTKSGAPTYAYTRDFQTNNGFGQHIWSRTQQLQSGSTPLTLKDQMQLYGSTGELFSSWEGTAANTTQYLYSSALGPSLGQVIQEVWGEGNGKTVSTPYKNTQFTYDLYGRPGQQTVDGFIRQYQYDSLDRPVSEKWFLDQNSTSGKYGEKKTRYHITGQPEVITETVQGSRPGVVGGDVNQTLTTTNTLDVLGQVTQTSSPDGGKISFKYDSWGRVVQKIDLRLQDYNDLGDSSSSGLSTYYKYDSVGKLLRQLDPPLRTKSWNGYVDARRPYTEFRYDLFGRKTHDRVLIGDLTKALDSAGFYAKAPTLNESDFKVTEYKYTALDQVKETISPRGYSTRAVYDPAGNPWQTEQDIFKTGDVCSEAPCTPKVTTYQSFDGAGRVFQSFDGNGYEFRKTYDRLGNVTAEMQPNSNKDLMVRKLYVYRPNGLLQKVLEPDVGANTGGGSSVTPFAPAALSAQWIPTSYSAMVTTQSLAYSGRQYPSSITRALMDTDASSGSLAITNYTYNGSGQPLTEKLPSQNYEAINVHAYDSKGQEIYSQNPEKFDVAKDYDQMGHVLTEHHWPRSTSTTASQEAVNVDTAAGFTPGDHPILRFRYDLLGNLVSETRSQYTTKHVYNTLSNTIAETRAYDPARTTDEYYRYFVYRLDGKKTADTTYDYRGNVQQGESDLTKLTDAAGNLTMYALTSDGLIQKETSRGSIRKTNGLFTDRLVEYTAENTYDGRNLRTSRTFSGDPRIYDNMQRNGSVLTSNGATQSAYDTKWTYDLVGNLLTMKDFAPGSSTPLNSYVYEYSATRHQTKQIIDVPVLYSQEASGDLGSVYNVSNTQYNNLDLITSHSVQDRHRGNGSLLNNMKVDYQYYKDGKMKSNSSTSSLFDGGTESGSQKEIVYDRMGRMSSYLDVRTGKGEYRVVNSVDALRNITTVQNLQYPEIVHSTCTIFTVDGQAAREITHAYPQPAGTSAFISPSTQGKACNEYTRPVEQWPDDGMYAGGTEAQNYSLKIHSYSKSQKVTTKNLPPRYTKIETTCENSTPCNRYYVNELPFESFSYDAYGELKINSPEAYPPDSATSVPKFSYYDCTAGGAPTTPANHAYAQGFWDSNGVGADFSGCVPKNETQTVTAGTDLVASSQFRDINGTVYQDKYMVPNSGKITYKLDENGKRIAVTTPPKTAEFTYSLDSKGNRLQKVLTQWSQELDLPDGNRTSPLGSSVNKSLKKEDGFYKRYSADGKPTQFFKTQSTDANCAWQPFFGYCTPATFSGELDHFVYDPAGNTIGFGNALINVEGSQIKSLNLNNKKYFYADGSVQFVYIDNNPLNLSFSTGYRWNQTSKYCDHLYCVKDQSFTLADSMLDANSWDPVVRFTVPAKDDQQSEFKAPIPSSEVGLGASSVTSSDAFSNPFLPGSDVVAPADSITQNATGMSAFSNPLPDPKNEQDPEAEPVDPTEYGPPVPLTDVNSNALGASNVADNAELNSSGSVGLTEATLPTPELNPNLSGSAGSSGVVAPDSELNPNIGGGETGAGGSSGAGSGVVSPEGPSVENPDAPFVAFTLSEKEAADKYCEGIAKGLDDDVAQTLCEQRRALGESKDQWNLARKDLLDMAFAQFGPSGALDMFTVIQALGQTNHDKIALGLQSIHEQMSNGLINKEQLHRAATLGLKSFSARQRYDLSTSLGQRKFIREVGNDLEEMLGILCENRGIRMCNVNLLALGDGPEMNFGAMAMNMSPGIAGGFTKLFNSKTLANIAGDLEESAASGLLKLCIAPCCKLKQSFDATTPVLTPNGTIPIHALTVGTLVLGFNEQTGEQGYYPIRRVFENQDPVLTGLVIEDPESKKLDYLTTTPEHPFYVMEAADSETRPQPEGHPDLSDRWVGAGHLKVGDKLKQADGTLGEVKYVNTIQQARTMYNLEVQEAHTFFVGNQGWLVHNCNPEEAVKFLLAEAKRLGIDLSNHKSITAAYDTVTGEWHLGLPGELLKGNVNPKTQKLINFSTKANKDKQVEEWQCGNCSEFTSLNKGFNANPARKPDPGDYQLYTFYPQQLAKGNATPRVACKYCEKIRPFLNMMYPKKK